MDLFFLLSVCVVCGVCVCVCVCVSFLPIFSSFSSFFFFTLLFFGLAYLAGAGHLFMRGRTKWNFLKAIILVFSCNSIASAAS